MCKHIFSFVFVLLFITVLKGQVSINESYTPTQLVQNFLMGGNGTVSNVNYHGSLTSTGSSFNQIAYFSGGNPATLGISDGIVLVTGNVIHINDSIGALMSDETALGGIPILDSIVNNSTFDAVSIDFDFIPEFNFINFNYVFASEEYPEYVCSDFNDIFAIFITGLNPLGGSYINQNIALLPDTNLPVCVNSINNGVSSADYTSSGCMTLNDSAYFSTTVDSALVFDGYTVPLEAKVKVIPGQVYHVKICLADVSDEILDSGVFLKSDNIQLVSTDILGNDTTLCLGDSIILNAGNYNNYQWSTGDTTASITLNSGNTSNIGIYNYSVIVIDSLNTYYVDTISIEVKDCEIHYIQTNMLGNDTTLCLGDSIILNAGSYNNYQWSTGDTTASITLNSGNISNIGIYNYSVIATDSLNAYYTDTIKIEVISCEINCTSANILGNDTIICFGDSITMNAGNYTHYQWSTGDTTALITLNSNDFSNYGINNYSIQVQDSLGLYFCDTINIEVSNCNLIQQNLSQEISILPNPASDYILIHGVHSDDIISIYSCYGNLLVNKPVSGNAENKVDISYLPKGIYVIKITGRDKMWTGKLVKQ